MNETVEFRIFKDYYHLLSKPNSAIFNGMVYVVEVTKEDPLYEEIGRLNRSVKEQYAEYFFGYYEIKRKYSNKELDAAALLHLEIKNTFEPTGEECGTIYDETVACKICGANRRQIGPLILRKGTIPKKDIARTIGGELVVSEKFENAAKKRNLKGLVFAPINFRKDVSGYFQLTAAARVRLSNNTVIGGDPFDLGADGSDAMEFVVSGGYKVKFDKEVYRCPNGDTVGLNLLSELYVLNNQLISEFDFLESEQKIGVKRGLLRPESVHFCSQAFKQMVEEEKLTGFKFEIANVE